MRNRGTSYDSKQVTDLSAGMFKDVDRHQVPLGGWTDSNNFHFYNGRMVSYNGWQALTGDGSVPLSGAVNFGYDFELFNKTRKLVLGTPSEMYVYNASTKVFSSIKHAAGVYTTPASNRWRVAQMNNAIYMTNGSQQIQVYTGTGVCVDLAGDSEEPTAARFIINFAGHLVTADITDSSGAQPQRLRWSDFGAPTIWTPADDNEANFADMPEDPGPILGMEILGPRQMVVFQTSSSTLVTYVGVPEVFRFERVNSTPKQALLAPYSIVNTRNQVYYLGRDDFYSFSGTGEPQSLGAGKIRDYFFGRFRETDANLVFGFAHPLFNEIWWVFKNKNGGYTLLSYNLDTEGWSYRDVFTHSMLCTFLQQSADRTWADIPLTTTWANVGNITWSEKLATGATLIISGDPSGNVWLHEKVANAGADVNGVGGSVIAGNLESGDVEIGKFPVWSNRLYMTLRALDQSDYPIVVLIGARNNFETPMSWGDSADVPTDEDWPYHDYLLSTRFMGVRIATSRKISLSAFEFMRQTAGVR